MNRDKGFTLVELLVSLFIVSLLSLISFRAIGVLLSVESGLLDVKSDFGGLQKAVRFLEHNSKQAVLMWDDGSSDSSLEVPGVVFESANSSTQFYRSGEELLMSSEGWNKSSSLALISGVSDFQVEFWGGKPEGVGFAFELTHNKFGRIERVAYFGVSKTEGLAGLDDFVEPTLEEDLFEGDPLGGQAFW